MKKLKEEKEIGPTDQPLSLPSQLKLMNECLKTKMLVPCVWFCLIIKINKIVTMLLCVLRFRLFPS